MSETEWVKSTFAIGVNTDGQVTFTVINSDNQEERIIFELDYEMAQHIGSTFITKSRTAKQIINAEIERMLTDLD